MNRVYNFSAGPSVLPEPVLKKAADEMLDCGGSGMSVMEMSHRSKEYDAIIKGAEALLRELMDIPANYKVLFLQGGASSQFAMVPLNLIGKTGKADYVITGQWSKKALQQAEKYGACVKIASSEDAVFNYIPELDPSTFSKDASYFHITTNNTIYGTRYTKLPDTGSVPLVADMSSNILSAGLRCPQVWADLMPARRRIWALAGLTVVIIREDSTGSALDITPIMFN